MKSRKILWNPDMQCAEISERVDGEEKASYRLFGRFEFNRPAFKEAIERAKLSPNEWVDA